MRLNRASDFALRVLIQLAKSDDALSVDELADVLALPKSHLMKIVAKLAQADFAETQRGRGGGVRLARAPEEIRIGAVVRAIENDFALVDCFSASAPTCVFEPRCALKPALREATQAFLDVLDGYTLAEISAKTRRPAKRAA